MFDELERVTLRIELGALLDAPIYESHRRGKNWLAKIRRSPTAPGGLAREFAEKAHDEYYYIWPEQWGIGTPVEFGADYYSGGGNKHPHRWYGVLFDMLPGVIVLLHTKTPAKAISVGEEVKKQKMYVSIDNDNARIIKV